MLRSRALRANQQMPTMPLLLFCVCSLMWRHEAARFIIVYVADSAANKTPRKPFAATQQAAAARQYMLICVPAKCLMRQFAEAANPRAPRESFRGNGGANVAVTKRSREGRREAKNPVRQTQERKPEPERRTDQRTNGESNAKKSLGHA